MTLKPIDDFEKEALTKLEGQLKIVEFRAENFKALKAIEIKTHGNSVIISGPNAAGKSSVLDAIWFALAGKDALKMNPDPVRHGERVAKVTLDLGYVGDNNFVKNAYTVTRTWSNGDSKLKITNNMGMTYGRPAGVLSSIVGDLSFDPLAFAGQSDKDQLKTLLELVNLPIDIYALDDDRRVKYDARRLINRAINHLEGKVAGFPVVDAPNKEVNTSDIMSAMELATTEISNNKDIRADYTQRLDAKSELIASIKNLENDLLRKQDVLVTLECGIDQLKPQVDSLIDPDLTVFKDQLQNAEQINSNVRSMQQRNQIIAELNAEKENSEELTAKINEIDELKEHTLQEANMPIDGLSFDSEGVNYNGSVFEQCSSAEKLKVSLAIAMAMNPKLRVIRIMDGSLLDSSNMVIIEEMAKDNDFQVWIELVDESGKLGVYIEDGSVAEVNA